MAGVWRVKEFTRIFEATLRMICEEAGPASMQGDHGASRLPHVVAHHLILEG